MNRTNLDQFRDIIRHHHEDCEAWKNCINLDRGSIVTRLARCINERAFLLKMCGHLELTSNDCAAMQEAERGETDE